MACHPAVGRFALPGSTSKLALIFNVETNFEASRD
jgi:hypothetical protein